MYKANELRKAILSSKGRSDDFPFGVQIDAASLASFKQEDHLLEALSQIRQIADKMKNNPLPLPTFTRWKKYEEAGDRAAYESVYFQRRNGLSALMSVVLFDNDESFLSTIEDLIWGICNEYAWAVPAHLPVGLAAAQDSQFPPENVVDLFAARTASLLAETIFLLGSRMNEWVKHRVVTELERRVFRPVFESQKRFGWEASEHNWTAVCMGAVGRAAFLILEDKHRLSAIADRVIGAMDCYLDGFGEDGGSAEGIGYWSFGFGHYVEFAEVLYTFTSGEVDLLQGDKIRRIASFPAAVHLSGTAYANFADVPQRVSVNSGLCSRLASRLNVDVPFLQGIQGEIRNFPPSLTNMLWTEARWLCKSGEKAHHCFENLQWVVDKKLVNGLPIAFAAKGGHNDEPHNHNDIGQFILHVGGEDLLCDIGSGQYTKDSFGPNRYKILHNASEGHSVPMIGNHQQEYGKEYAAESVSYVSNEEDCQFEMDMAGAYAIKELKQLIRSFEWRVNLDGFPELKLQDYYQFNDEPLPITESFMSYHCPTLNRNQIEWLGERGKVILTYDSTLYDVSVEPLQTLNHYGEPSTVYRLRLLSNSSQIEQVHDFIFTCIKGGPY